MRRNYLKVETANCSIELNGKCVRRYRGEESGE